MTDCLLVYITAANSEQALMLGKALVEERLAACVNITEEVKSFYWWQGKLENSTEALCLFKTTKGRFPALAARAKVLHSYETPCIVALPLEEGDAEYLAWIRQETKEQT